MFVIEGLPCVLLAFVVLKYLPDGPAEAPWPTAKEAALVGEAATREQEDGAKAAGTSCGSLLTVLRDKQMLIAIFASWTYQVALYSVGYFLPGITGGFVGPYVMGWAEESTGNHLAGRGSPSCCWPSARGGRHPPAVLAQGRAGQRGLTPFPGRSTGPGTDPAAGRAGGTDGRWRWRRLRRPAPPATAGPRPGPARRSRR
ncbi:hypothetical protein ACFVVA_01780 [Kitasatospora sp. NPDC058048]|uniref:hypothetical protein n=1 Tax=Kitasatospora sp. NPDC058048 TaxID=3346313 RepID=UPI0036DF23EF